MTPTHKCTQRNAATSANSPAKSRSRGRTRNSHDDALPPRQVDGAMCTALGMTADAKIRRLLSGSPLTRTAAAKQLGVSYSTFRSYLNAADAKRPGVDTAVGIARLFGVSADWLWDDSQGWPPPEAATQKATRERVPRGRWVPRWL